MLKSYWKIAVRHLLRSKGFSFLNIAGLALGMASAILILLWVQHERNFDAFHAMDSRLYEVLTSHYSDGKWGTGTATPEVIGGAMKRDCPEVEDVVRVGWSNGALFNYKETTVKVSGAPVDTGFFRVFSFPLVKGEVGSVLRDPYSVVLSQSLAGSLFGNEEPVGKIVKVDNDLNLTVTGVMKDLPKNTQFQLDWVNSYNYPTMKGYIDSDWTDVSIRSYALLKPHASAAAVNKRLEDMISRYAGEKVETQAFIYPFSRMRLYGEFEHFKQTGGRITTVRIFTLVAGLILLIACINFMNLSTARSERRSREVGIRKVVGARRTGLIAQFLAESMLVVVIAGLLALLLVQLTLPAFGALTGKQLALDFGSMWFWGGAFVFVLITGVLAGSYPAFFLSSFRPVTVLKGSFPRIRALLTPRKVLVVTQFTIAIVLIVSSLVIARQVQYAQSRKTGYELQNLIYTYMEGEVRPHFDAIRRELLQSGAVTAVSATASPMTHTYGFGSGFDWEGKPAGAHIGFMRSATRGGIVAAAGLKLVAGRDIDPEAYPTDSTACIINEAAVKATGLTHPIGQWLYDPPVKWHIVGVIKDFVLQSPYEPIKPFIIKGPKYFTGTIHMRLNGAESTTRNLAIVAGIFKKYNPAYPFEAHFIDADYAQRFEAEQLTGKLAGIFATLAIVISCLGLLGLAAYMAESRTKEIGIRKVLGASVVRISLLLSSGFVRLVLISIVIATPIAWYVTSRWLQGYSYRVSVEWWWFVAAGLLAVVIAVLAVSAQSVRAAVASPVKSLRSE